MMLKRISSLILLCMLAMLPARGTARADGGGGGRENQLKAAFIYNFAQFVEWPGEAFSGPSAPFVIGVLGDSSLAGMLEQSVKGKTAGKREIVVKYYSSFDSIQRSHILFVSASERERMGDLVRRAFADSTLTIGDFEGFTAASGMVRFLTEDNRLKFEVNLEATNQGHLRFSAQLLKLARMYNK